MNSVPIHFTKTATEMRSPSANEKADGCVQFHNEYERDTERVTEGSRTIKSLGGEGGIGAAIAISRSFSLVVFESS